MSLPRLATVLVCHRCFLTILPTCTCPLLTHSRQSSLISPLLIFFLLPHMSLRLESLGCKRFSSVARRAAVAMYKIDWRQARVNEDLELDIMSLLHLCSQLHALLSARSRSAAHHHDKDQSLQPQPCQLHGGGAASYISSTSCYNTLGLSACSISNSHTRYLFHQLVLR